MAHDRQRDSPGAPTCRRRKRGQQNQALSRSSGGFGTKIHLLSDALGNPIHLILTGGKRADCFQALPLLAGMKAFAVPADKGCDADYIVEEVTAMGAEAVIPPTHHRRNFRKYDKFLYKERKVIEKACGKMNISGRSLHGRAS